MTALTTDFLLDFKRLTEEASSVQDLDPTAYGGS
jgi:hypothetical protein